VSGFNRNQAKMALDLGWTQEEILAFNNQLSLFKKEVADVFSWGVVDLNGDVLYRGTDLDIQEQRRQRAVVHLPAEAYVDGSGTTFNKPAGIGVFIRSGKFTEFIAEKIGEGTNNRAELIAIWRAIRQFPSTRKKVVIHSDSEYAIGSLTKDWQPSANAELIRAIRQDLHHPLREGRITLKHVYGHAGNEGNEIADKLASIGRKFVQAVSVYPV
jgi:ribonuclease HI